MNNRTRNSMAAGIKFRKYSRYTSPLYSIRDLPNNIEVVDHPYAEWIEILLAKSKDENSSECFKWVNQKLKELEIKHEEVRSPYGTKKLSEEEYSHTRFSMTSFIDNPGKPAIVYAIAVNASDLDLYCSPATGIVQMLMLCLKLKETEEFVNAHIVFIHADDMKHAGDHLYAILQRGAITQPVGGLFIPGAAVGGSIYIRDRFAGPTSHYLHELSKHYELSWAHEDSLSTSDLYDSHSELREYDSAIVGFGLEEDMPFQEMEKYLEKASQIAFAESKEFQDINSFYYHSAILLSDYYRSHDLNMDFLH